MALESIPAYTGFRGGPVGQAYNEAAFRYFLDADRRRVERSGRSIILVLASIRQSPGRAARLPDATAAASSPAWRPVFVRSISLAGTGKAASPAPCCRRRSVHPSSCAT